jgi:hypothetical protein
MPFGETSFRDMVRAICSAEPVNVRPGGCVESVFTRRTHRFFDRLFRIASQFSIRFVFYSVAYAYGLSSKSILQLCEQK